MDIIVGSFTTLLGVILGIIAGPYADKFRRHSERKEATRNFYIELQDLTELLKKPIADAYNNFAGCVNGRTRIIVLEPLEIITIDGLLSHPLDALSYGERNGLRKMRLLVKNINDIVNNEQVKFGNDPNFWRQVIRMLAALYALVELMLKDKREYTHCDNASVNDDVSHVLDKIIADNKEFINEIAHNKTIPKFQGHNELARL
jgi:Zn-dependent oligopeptidase